MTYFDVCGYDGCAKVEKTDEGIRVNNKDYTVVKGEIYEGDKLLDGDKHIYTVFFSIKQIALGKDHTW
jgi:hypothetical protein